jgi:hypothetical protein
MPSLDNARPLSWVAPQRQLRIIDVIKPASAGDASIIAVSADSGSLSQQSKLPDHL